MAELAGELSYRFSADTGQIRSQFADLKSQFNELGRISVANSNELSKSLQSVQGGLASFSQFADVKSQFNEVGRISVANSNELSKSLQSVQGGLASFSNLIYSQLNILRAGFVGLVGTLGTVAVGFAAIGAAAAVAVGAISAAAAAFGPILSGVVSLGVEVQKMAGDFDQSTESISAFANVANRSGVEVSDLGKKLSDLQNNLSDEAEETTRALGALGLSVDSIKGKNFPETLKVLADRFSTTQDSANKTAIAVALFGEEIAGKLLPQLNRGADYLQELEDASKRAGSVITAELSDKIQGTYGVWQKLGDAAYEVGEAFKGIGITIYERVKPAIDAIIQVWADLIKGFANFIEYANKSAKEGGALSVVLDGIAILMKSLAAVTIAAAAALRVLLAAASFVFEQISNIVSGSIDVFVAFGKDVIGNSVGAFQAMYNAAKAAVDGIVQIFTYLGQVIGKVLDFSGAAAAFEKLKASASEIGPKIAQGLILPGAENTSAAFDAFGERIKRSASVTGEAIKKIIADAGSQFDTLLGSGAAPAKKNQPNVASEIPANDNAATAANEAKSAVERYIDSLKKAVAVAEAESQTWQATNVERARAVALAQARAAAEKDNVELTKEQIQEVDNLASRTQNLRDQVAAVKDASKQISDAFASSIDNILVQGQKLQNVFSNLVRTLASSVLKGVLTGDGAFKSIGGDAGSGGLLGGLSRSLGSLFGGFRAEGGDTMGGRAYIVGERGPELFMPNGGGTIIPNGGAAPNASSSAAPIVIVYNNAPQAQVSARNGPSGNLMVFVEDAMASAVAKPGGQVQNAFANAFGLNPAAGIAR